MALPEARGVWAPALTPVDARGEPDAARFVAHARWLLDTGCHGIGLFGTTSEANSFSITQRMRLLEATVQAGIPAGKLMVGTGCCALADSIALTRHAVELGCPHMLMLPPFYYKGVALEGLYQSFARVIEAVGRGRFNLFLYHIPPISQVPIPVALVDRLAHAYPETLRGVKDSSGEREHTLDLIRRFRGLEIFPGSEGLLLEGLRAGGAGCISASANTNPHAIRAVFDAHAAGRPEADALQARVQAVRTVAQRFPMIPGLKHTIATLRKDPPWRETVPPLVPLPEAEGAKLMRELAEAGFEPA